jgi:hypothetical protein
MDSCKVNGTFCTVKTKEVCDFWTKVGIPEEHCKKLLGTHWEMKLQVNGKKVFADQKCCECPEYNSCGVFMEGTEIEIPAMPGFGGKVKMCFKKTAENVMHSKFHYEGAACVEWTETYCDDGIKMELCCKEKGLTVCEKWCRKVCETGFYKFKKCEGDLNALFEPFFGKEFKIDECFKEKLEIVGDTYKGTSCAAGKTIKQSWKLDEETCMEGVSMLVTSVGVGKYKIIYKKGDMMLECSLCFSDCGYSFTAVCHKTGKTATLCMERYCEMSGTYKPVSYSGTKEVCAAMGAPPELVQKLLNDSKAMVCITMDGPFYCFSFKSSIMPMEMAFKVGEEFDFASPFDPTDVQKCLYAVNGNCMIGSSKGKFDATHKMTFTNSFLIMEYHLTGTPLCEKVIYRRVDCE